MRWIIATVGALALAFVTVNVPPPWVDAAADGVCDANAKAAPLDFTEYWTAGRLNANGENPYDGTKVRELQRSVGLDDTAILCDVSYCTTVEADGDKPQFNPGSR